MEEDGNISIQLNHQSESKIAHFCQIEHTSFWSTWKIVRILHFKLEVICLFKLSILIHHSFSSGISFLHLYLNILVFYSCVISTLCTIPNREFHLVNPTTQVALFSVCQEDCSSLVSIKWNIYKGFNTSLSIIQWELFNQTDIYENIYFFGKDPLFSFISFDKYYSRYENKSFHSNKSIISS